MNQKWTAIINAVDDVWVRIERPRLKSGDATNEASFIPISNI